MSELLPDGERVDELGDLEDAVERNCSLRDTVESLAALEGHDRAILDHLRGRPSAEAAVAAGPAGARALGGGEAA